MEDGKPAKRRGQGGPQQEQAQTRRPTLSAIRRATGPPTTRLAGQTPNWRIPTAARQKGMDTETGQPGTQTVGHPDGGFILHMTQFPFGLPELWLWRSVWSHLSKLATAALVGSSTCSTSGYWVLV